MDRMTPHEFVWTLAGKIADAAKAHFDLARGAIGHVDVSGAEDGVYVSDDTGAWSRVTVQGHTGCADPGVVPYIRRLSGFHTRDQWVKQLHDAVRRLPILTAANGWVEDAKSISDLPEVKPAVKPALVDNTDRRKWDVVSLVAEYRADKLDRSRAWSRFVIDRDLKPEIDAKEFYKVFDQFGQTKRGGR